MAAALQTDSRNIRGVPRVDNWSFVGQWNASAVTPFYRGSAIMNRVASVDTSNNDGAGTALPMPLAAAVQGVFGGVLIRDQDVPIGDETASVWTGASFEKENLLVVSRYGACRFDAVVAAGTAATPTQAWIGRTAWFHSDHEVGLQPPVGPFPIPAGQIIGFDAAAQEVLVDYTRHVGVGPQVEFLAFSALTVAGTTQTISKDNDAKSVIPVRRSWIARAHVNNTINSLHATTTLEVQIDAGTPKTLALDALAAGESATGTLGLEVDTASKIGILITSGGNLTADEIINVLLECYPLTQ